MLEREANQEKTGRREANRDQCQTTQIANKDKGIGRFITSWPIPSGWIRSQVLYPLSYGRIRCVIKNYGESVKEVEDANIKCLKGNLPRAYQLPKSYCTVSSSQVSFTTRAFHNCQVSTPPSPIDHCSMTEITGVNPGKFGSFKSPIEGCVGIVP